MKVIETTLGIDLPPTHALPLWLRLLTKIVPLANPDFHDHYHKVRKWWVEIDEDGIPQRELGLSDEGNVVVAGPLNRNFGFWTDSDMKFAAADYRDIPEQDFEAAWSIFVGQQK